MRITLYQHFTCNDKAVSALLATPNAVIGLAWGFYVIVALDNKNPAAWMVESIDSAPFSRGNWTFPGTVMEDVMVYKGPVAFDRMPTVPLAKWNECVFRPC